MTTYQDCFYRAADGLTLYARDYAGPGPDAPVVLCMHGLTRNSRDFADLARLLAADFRVIVPDQRGRGRSDRDAQADNYHPGTYVADMWLLLAHLGVTRAVLVGTSLGGLMAMMMTANAPKAVAGVVLNDIGPVIEAAGLARISSYVGKMPPPDSWQEAEEQTRTLNGDVFPDFTPGDWLSFTRALYRDEGGRPVPDYDPAIAQGVAAGSAVPPDLWPLFDSLRDKPLLAVRGALSDILSAATLGDMQRRHPAMRAVTVPQRGHAPLLIEPAALAEIDAFLAALRSGGAFADDLRGDGL